MTYVSDFTFWCRLKTVGAETFLFMCVLILIVDS